jgi:hypothetical protein
MGATATLRAASMPDVDVAAVIALSPARFPSRYFEDPPENDLTKQMLGAIDEPKLIVACEDDLLVGESGDLVRFADEARSIHRAAPDPKQLVVLACSAHGVGLVTSTSEGAIAAEVSQLILDTISAA